jgi:hypothetical protein
MSRGTLKPEAGAEIVLDFGGHGFMIQVGGAKEHIDVTPVSIKYRKDKSVELVTAILGSTLVAYPDGKGAKVAPIRSIRMSRASFLTGGTSR